MWGVENTDWPALDRFKIIHFGVAPGVNYENFFQSKEGVLSQSMNLVNRLRSISCGWAKDFPEVSAGLSPVSWTFLREFTHGFKNQ